MSDTTNQRHPDSTFQATYPYNQATITRSGHELHFNDTPNHESIRLAHTKGTYFEIESTGRWIHTIAEKAYQYIKSSYTQTIDSHADIKISGTYTFNCDQSAYEAIGTDKTVGIGGNLIDGVTGIREVHTERDKFESVTGDYALGIQGGLYQAVEGDHVSSVSGVKSDILQSDWSVISAASIEMNAQSIFRIKCDKFIVDAREITMTTKGGDVTVDSDGKVTVKGNAEILVDGKSSVTINAMGITYVNGTQIRLND